MTSRRSRLLVAAAGLAVVGAVQAQMLLAGMAGFQGAPRHPWRLGAALVIALALWMWLAPGGEPHWMWILPFAGLVSGACFTVTSRQRWMVLGAAFALAVLTGTLADELATGFIGGSWVLTFAALCIAQVWIWDVTLRLDEARANAAENAVLRERLRFAGDLHDIQGHQLQAIALKAQLAARLIGRDDEAARGHASDAHALALEALAETRQLVQGYRRVGLATELANAVGILRAAGVDAAVEGTPEAGAGRAAAAVRLARPRRRDQPPAPHPRRALRDRGRA